MIHIQYNSPKNPTGFTVESDKLIIKFICKCKGSRIIKTILKKKCKVGRLVSLDFKTRLSDSNQDKYIRETIETTHNLMEQSLEIDQNIKNLLLSNKDTKAV